MSTSAISYLPATFTETREVFTSTPAVSQDGDWAKWEQEYKDLNSPANATGGANSSASSASSSLNSGLISALLPILSALIAWMSQAMSSDSSQGGSDTDDGSSANGGGVQTASYSGGGNGANAGPNVMHASAGNPAGIAEGLQHRSADSIVANQDVPMDHGISDHEDCANFASGCLVKSGEISASQHTDSVGTLRGELLHQDGWHEESKSQVKPGDVCIVGGDQHVEIVDGVDKNGNVILIGSNNDLPNGAQEVTKDSYTGNQGNVEFLSK